MAHSTLRSAVTDTHQQGVTEATRHFHTEGGREVEVTMVSVNIALMAWLIEQLCAPGHRGHWHI